MDTLKSFSRRSFWIIILFHLFLFSLFYGYQWYLVVYIKDPNDLVWFNQYDKLGLWSAFFLMYGILVWRSCRNSLKKVLKRKEDAKGVKPSAKKQSKIDKARIKARERRLFLHMISVLQREGRLLDFFYEDLDAYDDAQIGAAVRNIHENCRKVMDKYIGPKAVMSREEGDSIQVDKDFDQSAIKLIGNVAGKPPFEGVLKHKGWQSKPIEVPALSDSNNPLIIAPCEIEII